MTHSAQLQESIKKLHRERGRVKTRLTKIETYLNSKQEFNEEILRVYEENLPQIKEEFKSVQSRIYILVSDDDDMLQGEEEEEVSFEDRVTQITARIRQSYKILKALENDKNGGKSDKASNRSDEFMEKITTVIEKLAEHKENSMQSKAKLPDIPMKQFSGKYSDWESFRDSFVTNIDKNTSLSAGNKFQYLKGLLTGKAESIIKHLKVTEANYTKAWETLENRFNKPQNTSDELMDLFIDQPYLKNLDRDKLRMMYDIGIEVLNGLEAIECDQREAWPTRLYVKMVDDDTRLLWARENKGRTSTTFRQFLEFLDNRCSELETIPLKPAASSQGQSRSATQSIVKNTKPNTTSKDSNIRLQTQKSFAIREFAACKICAQTGHPVYHCPTLTAANAPKRLQLVQAAQLCTNCLSPSHTVESCRRSHCKQCQLLHNTLLHESFSSSAQTEQKSSNDKPQAAQAAATNAKKPPVPSPRSSTSNLTLASTMDAPGNISHDSRQEILLPTISLFATGADGRFYRCRAFYDSCSQPNLITKRFAEKAFLQLQTAALRPLKGVTQQSMQVQQTATATISSRDKNFTQTLVFVVVDEIADRYPSCNIIMENLPPDNIPLADPDFNKPGRVDMLIGAQMFGQTIQSGKYGNSPEFTETVFGYIASGTVSLADSGAIIDNACFLTIDTDTLHQRIERFLSIEEPEECCVKFTPSEQLCEQLFMEHTTRDEHGRFIVRLPTKDNLHLIGETRPTALRRFLCMERKLQRDPELKLKYVSFMQEYEQLGHMRKVPDSYSSDQPEIYLPHHAVIKTSSKSTPVRVVFDASAKSSTGISLNDALMIGPKTQDDLLLIVLRFGQHPVVVKADAKKMFRQVRVHEDDQNMQRILWRDSPDKPILPYLLATVTYGTACAGYLSTRSMGQLVVEEGDNYPLAKQPAANDFYVDDFMSGKNTIAEAKELCAQMYNLMKQGGFVLTKWMSNEPEVIQQFPPQEHEIESTLGLSPDDTVKALGLRWNPTSDTYSFDAVPYMNTITKRIALSEISKIFDPLGLLSAITINAKLLMQILWLDKIDWDARIEDSQILHMWTEFQQSITEMHLINIPRQFTSGIPQTVELLAFSDASTKAYAACVYVRAVSSDGRETCRLLCAKSKVAPLKPRTIPRMELCGAVVAVKLIRIVTSALTLKIDSIRAFTDSTIVLHWLAAEDPRKWKTFVANRVADIQNTLTREHWDYVPSEYNPADIATRGTSARDLADNDLWWHGPNLDVCGLQEYNQLDTEGTNLEQRVFFTQQKNEFWEVIDRFSSYRILIRALVQCSRFAHNEIIHKFDNTEKIVGPLTVDELQSTRLKVIKAVQMDSFAEDIHNLKQKKELSRKSHIRQLNPFIDSEGILRVGGRIGNSRLNYDTKHQILLDHKHHFTELVVRQAHEDTYHGGHNEVLAKVRQQYWPIGGLNLVKKVAKNCIKCFRTDPKLSEQKMGDLPAPRVQPTFPFKRTGVDFCGPFMIKPPLRKSAIIKVYVAVYVCLVTKAVFLDVVDELTSEAFIASLRRFCAKRRKPDDIYCDNGRNFVGAQKIFTKVHKLLREKEIQDTVKTFSAQRDIKFHFIPPYSPHWGGLWEAAVKCFKTHLKRSAGNHVFSQRSFDTVVAEIEAVMNSRPLCSMSNDPNDYRALTPAHFLFLYDTENELVTHEDLSQIQQNRLSKWRVNEQIVQHFWKRWHKEIINTMQQRKKWQKDRPNIQIDDLVLIQEDNVPPLKWSLGRVIDVSYGSDDLVRAATIRTQNGTTTRVITRLAVLPNGERPTETALLSFYTTELNKFQREEYVTTES